MIIKVDNKIKDSLNRMFLKLYYIQLFIYLVSEFYY